MAGIFDLPVELRNEIYRLAFADLPVHPVQQHGEQTRDPGALLRVNRQIRSEATALFYHHANFVVTVQQGNGPRMVRWLHGIGEQNVRALRRMVVRYRPENGHFVSFDLTTAPADVVFTPSLWAAIPMREHTLALMRSQGLGVVHADGGEVVGIAVWTLVFNYLSTIPGPVTIFPAGYRWGFGRGM